jgi:hypothetical protein
MSLAFPDVVAIVSVGRDVTFNTETESRTPKQSRACVEEDSRLQYTDDGAPIEPTITIMLPRDAVVQKGDYIAILKLHNKDATEHEGIRRLVKRASRVGGSRISHIEVLV